MIRKVIRHLIEPRSSDPDRRSRETVLNVLFLGTLALIVGAFLVVAINYIFLDLRYLASRVLIIGSILGVMAVLYYLSRRQFYLLASYSLLLLYFSAAVAVMYVWGMDAQAGVLLFALFIIFAGIFLGSKYSLYALLLVVGVLICIMLATMHGVLHPDVSWVTSTPGFTDVVTFSLIFANLALTSWLFNRSMEESLRRAKQSERGLKQQKALLEVRVEERSRQLQAAQLERIQALYRFAELGHVSVALLHDVANYLTVLSLDIEGLKQDRKNRSTVMQRVQQSIQHLSDLIERVRHQIKGEANIKRFNLAHEIDEVVKMLAYKAKSKQVRLELKFYKSSDRSVSFEGNVNHFRQLLVNLISNSIDAYPDSKKRPADRNVLVSLKSTQSHANIEVIDYGVGIPPRRLKKIFEPFYSTKEGGIGIGLFIAKKVVEKDFNGSMRVTSRPGAGTTFTIRIPLDNETQA